MDRTTIVWLRSKHSNGFEYAPNVEGIERSGKIYKVDFGGGKCYNYSPENVRLYKLKITHRAVRLYEDGWLRGQYDELDDYGEYLIGRCADRQTSPIRRHQGIEICDLKTDLDRGQKLLDYYRAILEGGMEISHDLPNDDTPLPEPDKQSLRDMQLGILERIDLSESRSALAYYINGKLPPPAPLSAAPIFPFGCNESQKLAVESALNHAISVVEGPPGTGKTQTILNIIANLVVQGKSVAVVSNNNTAVFNVRDKLTKYGYGGLVASLGNKDNRVAFFDNLPTLSLPESARLGREELKGERSEVGRLGTLLAESFRVRSALSSLKAQLQDAELEQRHILQEQPLPQSTYTELEGKFRRQFDYDRVLQLKTFLEQTVREGGKMSWMNRLRLAFSFGLFAQRSLKTYADELPIYLNHKFYELYIEHLRAEIATKEAWLLENKESELLDGLVERSRKVFEATLLERYEGLEPEEFTMEGYKLEFDTFIRHYPVVTSSTLSLPTSIPRGFLFDYVIIDEASQVDSIKGVMSLACSRRAVIVGDSMQLAHIVNGASKTAAADAFEASALPEAYDYVRHSILSSLKALLGDKLRSVLLREHYRCHPAIIGFCNKKYYDGQLVVMTEGDGCPFKIIEVNIADGGNDYSQRQIDETDLYIRSSLMQEELSVGVITPYREHADRLKAQLPRTIESDTIHRYQGREKDVILFNTVRPKITTFMDNPNLINVAVSRAVREFIVVKPEGMELPHGTNVGDLVRYMMYYAPEGCQIIKGQLRSVFDVLYGALEARGGKSRQMFDAEELVCTLLREDILPSSPQFASLTFAREYGLRDLVRDTSRLTPQECTYIRNNARLDFLLYSKLDKAAILAIEVDGVHFHSTPEQQVRDEMKNHILEVLGLPLLRLSTDGHSERQRITEAIREAMISYQ